MKKITFILAILTGCVMSSAVCSAQTERVKNRPYADLRLFHLGFHVGMHTQDLILTRNALPTESGEVWFAQVPDYSPGFSVGVIGDMRMNNYFNLRLTPTIHFGDKTMAFKEEASGEIFNTQVRSNYVTLPLTVKYSAARLNNIRPYISAGGYAAMNVGRKKGNPILLNPLDFGIELGIGCDIYLAYFKLSPELKFCFGLTDALEHERPDLIDQDILKYSASISKAMSRMIVLTFNFE